MKELVNIHELTKKFNEARQEHQKDAYLYDQLIDLLNGLGFNKSICKSLTKFFESEKIGCAKLYKFSKLPVHEIQIKSVYDAHRRACKRSIAKQKRIARVMTSKPTVGQMTDEELLAEVKSRGFKMCKPVFDEKTFKAENPVLYKKYLKFVVAD